MDQLSMKNEEKLINNILFLYILGVAISGWAFVMIFLNGGARECVFLRKKSGKPHKICVRLYPAHHWCHHRGSVLHQ